MPSPHAFPALQRALAVERARLVQHPLYAELGSLARVRTFLEHHAFAVWDFMSLLKALQRALTCVEVPWVPRGDALARRLINEIVLGEESDDVPGGGYASHFELYLAAMRECGADVSRVEAFVAALEHGRSARAALAVSRVPAPARRFVESTLDTLDSASLPRIAAAFTLGREELIPDMFTRLVDDLSRESGGRLARFRDYLERHIRLDGERHGPMAARMLESICGDDERCWQEAERGAREALAARLELWDGVRGALGPARPAGQPAPIL